MVDKMRGTPAAAGGDGLGGEVKGTDAGDTNSTRGCPSRGRVRQELGPSAESRGGGSSDRGAT